jgi:hypothetical protein
MEPSRQKKKPIAKLEQILMPEKEVPKPIEQPVLQIQPTTTTVSVPDPAVKQQKKRGRKRKIPINIKYNDPDYIVMWPEICMAQKVLVDKYDNVYSFDLEQPIWLGVKTVYGKIDNSTHKAPLTKYYFQP